MKVIKPYLKILTKLIPTISDKTIQIKLTEVITFLKPIR
jgi:hypothetical protein